MHTHTSTYTHTYKHIHTHTRLQVLDYILRDRGKVDIIFMDIQMPVMGGMEATERLKRHPLMQGQLLPVVVACTASVLDSEQVL